MSICLAAALLVLTMPLPASAAWPTVADMPLVLGDLQGIGSLDQDTLVTHDRATWAAWEDTQCFGTVRGQRVAADGTVLVPGALGFDTSTDCNSRRVLLAEGPSSSVYVATSGSSGTTC